MPIISFAMSNRSLNTASSRDCGSSRQVVVGYLNQNLVYGGEEGRKRGTRRGSRAQDFQESARVCVRMLGMLHKQCPSSSLVRMSSLRTMMELW